MLIITERAYARAGLVGNPSDGYNGKTISLIVKNLFAEVVLYEWDEIEILRSEDRTTFRSVQELARDVKLHGYYGGIRLVKAAIKTFVEFCEAESFPLHSRTFAVRYETTIPRQVGLAGSSAIIMATLRCLMKFYEVTIPQSLLPSLALAVETRELGIAAGLQDRVVQAYEGLVYMDFAAERMREHGRYEYGVYEPLDPALLPPLYVAYKADVSEPTEVFHNQIRARFVNREPAVVNAMKTFAALAAEARDRLVEGNTSRLEQLINENFDTRRSIYQLPAAQVEMVERARSTGASAQFAGSGGAIVGVYRDRTMLEQLRGQLSEIGCKLIEPIVTPRQSP